MKREMRSTFAQRLAEMQKWLRIPQKSARRLEISAVLVEISKRLAEKHALRSRLFALVAFLDIELV
ncbi:MAG: hypothetical protein IKU63_06190 [Bacteroidaceae bacterium]|nr:hypothetical protein [Bacteroidaceae bacterium]